MSLKKKDQSEKVGNPPDYTEALAQFAKYYPDIAKLLNSEAIKKIGLDAKGTKTLGKAALDIISKSAKTMGKAAYQNESTYAPGYASLYSSLLDTTDPEFRAVRNKLGAQVSGDLDKGYELGDDLSKQIEQDVRAGQDSRGNWYGEAPIAAEAVMKARERLAMYDQRQQAATNFLNSTSAVDKLGAIRGATNSTQFYTPGIYNSGYDPSGTALNLSQQQYQNQQNHFQELLAATNQRNNATATDYDYYLKRSSPYYNGYGTTGGGGSSSGSGWGQAAGMVGGGIAAGVGTAATLTAAGVGTATTAGLGAGAAASAALGAAVCWIARSVYGERNPKWRRFHVWLMIEAPRWFRRIYVKHGQAFAAWLDKRGAWLKPAIREAMDLVTA